jgi:hypothetical protein
MTDSFKTALAEAQSQLVTLVEKRATVDSQIHRVTQLIKQLAAHVGIDADGALAPLTVYENRGLTSGIRAALKESGKGKTAGEVRQILLSFGYDLSNYANASAVINTVLNRFDKQGLVDKVPQDGTIRYRWKSAGDEILKRGWQEVNRKWTRDSKPG